MRHGRLLRAFIASFAVYLLPVAGRHGFWLWGYLIFRELSAGEERRAALWLATDMGLALALQVAAGAVFWWIFAGRRRRWLAVVPAAPALLVILNWTYLEAIPVRFLIDPDIAAERTDWEVACTVPDARVSMVRAGIGLELEQAREAWIERGQKGRYAVLTMPGCRLREVDLSFTNMGGVDYVAPGGAVLFRTYDKGTGRYTHWFSARAGEEPVLVQAPDVKYWQPVLSADGTAIAWMTDEPAREGRDVVYTFHIRALGGGGQQAITLRRPQSEHLKLLAFDAREGELVLVEGFDAIVGIGLDGGVRWGPIRAGGIEHLFDNIRRHGKGWVAWESPGSERRNRVIWSLYLGKGRHQVLKGRAITAAALDAWGRYIALSLTSALSIGDIRDSVYVLRVHDGREAYRRYLPADSRGAVAFLGAHFLALTRTREGEQWIEVLRVPGHVPIARARAWRDAYRAALLPLLPLYEKYETDGLGEEDCGPVTRARQAIDDLPPAPDRITAETLQALAERLGEADFQCQRWDPGPFSLALDEIQFIMTGIEDGLIYEHGLEALPEVEALGWMAGGFSTRPVTGPGNSVRVKRFHPSGG